MTGERERDRHEDRGGWRCLDEYHFYDVRSVKGNEWDFRRDGHVSRSQWRRYIGRD